MTMEAAISIQGLTKDFAIGLRGTRLRAVDNLSLHIGQGQIFGLLGPNGSGKSTMIKLILDLLQPTAGKCLIFGIPHDRAEARRAVGYLPELPHFHRYLTGRELVGFHAGLAGLSGGQLARRVDEVMAWAGLANAADRRVGTYSKGMLQRAGLAQALVHDPRLVILDEPAAGMDPAGVEEISTMVLQLKAEGRTVVMVSHLLGQMEEVCDRMAILNHGRLVWEGTRADLTGASGRQALVVDELPVEQLGDLCQWLEQRGSALRGVGRPALKLAEIFRRHTTVAETRRRF
jgi:ABC-2 type transport system ATP-binding protein